MNSKFSQKISNILIYSKEEAIRLNNDYIGTEHLFLGILRDGEGIAIQALHTAGADLDAAKAQIESRIMRNVPSTDSDEIPLLKSTEHALTFVYLEARATKSDVIDTGHLLLAILHDDSSIVHSKAKNTVFFIFLTLFITVFSVC